MKKIFGIFVIAIGLVQIANAQNGNLRKLLYELPDVIFKEIEPTVGFISAYELDIKQPLDHSQPSLGSFYQKVFLSHRGFEKPVVMKIGGYDWDTNWNQYLELPGLLDANQIIIEHRFFGDSKPDSINYQFLNFEQITADLHRINQLFKTIYQTKWVSTGRSKGGVTSLVYKYFYPDDIDVVVPFVAPLNLGLEDSRYQNFLDTIGTNECRSKIDLVQRRLLKNRNQVLPLLKYYSKGAKAEFMHFSIGQAFEYAVLDLPMYFWYGGFNCDKIPDDNSSIHDIVDYLISTSDILNLSDETLATYQPYFYQATTEMGGYKYGTEKLIQLVTEIQPNLNANLAFLPIEMRKEYDGTLMKKVDEWLRTEGNKIIYVYGGSDFWTAGAIPFSKRTDAVWIIMKGKNHLDARIEHMNQKNKQKLNSTLEKWLSLKIENTLPNKK